MYIYLRTCISKPVRIKLNTQLNYKNKKELVKWKQKKEIDKKDKEKVPWGAARRMQEAWSSCGWLEVAGVHETLAAFLRKSGKWEVPWRVGTVKPAKHKELARCDENWLYSGPATRAQYWDLWGSAAQGHLQGQDQQRTSEKGGPAQQLQQGSSSMAHRVLQALPRLKMVEKDQDESCKLTV